jgi:hypothetical protein
MKKYIGTKIIDAEPMTLGDYNGYKGWVIPENEDPTREGYLVKYSDNYISWCPKEAFEEAYVEKGTNELYETCLLMKSNDFKDRFVAEFIQLDNRIRGLRKMLEKYKDGTLPFKPKSSYDNLFRQLVFMESYLEELGQRAVLGDINLSY